MILAPEVALKNVRRAGLSSRYPSKSDKRTCTDHLFPRIQPKFKLNRGETIFTLGSCFARNIEQKLVGFDLPAVKFSVPKTEWPYGPNGILNEYNPGTMCQRIVHASRRLGFGNESVLESEGGAADLLLPGSAKATTLDRLMERRGEIDRVYETLFGCDGIIITLGLIEAWYDTSTSLYLNRMPPPAVLARDKERYEFRVLDVEQASALTEQAVQALIGIGISRILLTVSPVPFDTSFSGDDAVVANSYSKSVLRVCAGQLCRKYPEVDYFPSYEIVISGGLGGYLEDNIHVEDELVGRITNYMIENYVE